MTELLDIAGLEKNFDGVRALADFSCLLRQREILGLIGPNGAGKTTFFNVISGFIIPERGRVVLRGRDITGVPPHRITNLGIARTFQNLRLIRQISVLDNVLLCFQNQPGEKLRRVFASWRRCWAQEKENQEEAITLLERVGLSQLADDQAENLSYGQQKLLSLACCLATKADVLLLDEPVAGISPEMTERILEYIRTLSADGKSVILIEHNIDAVMRVCDRIIFMDTGAKVSEGRPEEVKNDPRVVEAYLS